MTHAAATHPGDHGSAKPFQPFGVDIGTFGMWLFLASEVMFFTGLLGSYLVYRVSYADPTGDLFEHDAAELDWRIGGLNTLLLITSSYTMVLAVVACEKGNAAKLKQWLLATAAMGTGFLLIKIFLEYLPKIQHGHGPDHSLFFSCYYALTGVHGLHVFGGVIPLVVLAFQAKRLAETRSQRIEIMGLYWHFVDLVWIFLFPLLYLVG